MAEAKPDRRNGRTVSRGAHWIEWLTGGLCTALVAAMIAWIASNAVIGSDRAPDLAVRIIRQQANPGGGYAVSFVIENSGTRTAAAVPVTGDLKDGDRVIETHEVTFDYVPAQSSTTGALLFKTDPSAHMLDIRASGYVDP
ncbi:TIGR02588 family protein [Rhizobium herbae]|uniref:Uncharacterized protein (TIGR02588 family) n=1 Tax=Rhizobium herbae TaxID=508661 RepID=A0ABS4EVI2_9HYPH|nr:TIGR02588 family protein [Rhizobium herbae]MBP1861965.1 uncharacterized protein (TIGR02588 family) [Rhizobium herbae]